MRRRVPKTDTLRVARATWRMVHLNTAQDLVCMLSRMDRVGRALDRRTRHYILALQAAATREAPLVAPGARPRRLARSALPRLARAAPVSSAVRPDGSLTIHIQCGSPDESRAPNWLPAPPAQFHLILRLFGPEDAFFDGSYTLPPVVRVAP